jgi:AcrR family transcriptional regulator
VLSNLASALELRQDGDMPSTPATTARNRIRAELTGEIKQIARRQLAEQGSAALSLRAVARELGMVSSAVYRYFPSRDDLLTALIVDAYVAVAEALEQADGARRRTDFAGRWLAIARALRTWALANPQEYALIYGSPVPGYQAPADTIDPAARVSLVFLRLMRDAAEAGAVATGEAATIPKAVRADFDEVRRFGDLDAPDEVVSRGLLVWTELFGTLSYELFGHLHNVIHDYDAFFDVQMRRSGQYLLTGA